MFYKSYYVLQIILCFTNHIMFYKSYYVLQIILCFIFVYIFISTMRAHNINKTNSTRRYGKTECDRKRKRSSFTVPEVVAAIEFVIVIPKPSCRNELINFIV